MNYVKKSLRVIFLIVIILIEDGVNTRTTTPSSRSISFLKEWLNDFSPVPVSGCSKATADDVRFYLFTKNSYNMEILNVGDASTLTNSTYDARKQTKILVHGWRNDGLYFWKDTLEAYFNVSTSINTIVVDWHRYSPPCLDLNRVIEEIGSITSDMLNFLIDCGVKPTRIHMIGYSLGSQIAGYAAHDLPEKLKIARITGLDPVGFGFYMRSVDPILNRKDANFVDCIHTSLGTVTAVQIGHADFYPNGGMYQPNCSFLDVTCSHAMSPVYFTHSITHPKAYCSTMCDNYLDYQRNMCNDEQAQYMGEYVSTDARGKYYLDTKGVEAKDSC